MIIFHFRQSDCARRARKNENAGTFNFTSQIASLTCTVTFTKCIKPDATIFKSRCSRMTVNCRFMTGHALLLSQAKVFRLANSSPMIQRSPARRSRNVREPSGKTSGEMSRVISAQLPSKGRTTATQGRRASVKTTHKTTCLAPDMDTQCPRRKLARQLAIWSRNKRAAVRATANATSHERLVELSSSAFNHDIQRL